VVNLTPGKFIDVAMSNPANVALLSRLPSLGLRECYLTAGCLFQPVWNHASGWAADQWIKDYDVFYFDAGDLSWDAEDLVIKRVEAIAVDLGIRVEARNQARVHLWYEKRFGTFCPELTSTRHGIDRYLIACACVGIDVASKALCRTASMIWQTAYCGSTQRILNRISFARRQRIIRRVGRGSRLLAEGRRKPFNRPVKPVAVRYCDECPQ
jgi:hypothetical protein